MIVDTALKDGSFENFPLRIVASTLLVQAAIYILGAYIVLQFGLVFLAIYIACVLGLEYRVLRHSCVNCSYYGMTCCFGRGRLCALIFRKGDPKRFRERKIGWVDILPDFLISTIPLLLGIILLVLRFDVLLLAVVVALALLAFPGTGFIRSRWACRYCRQRQVGCPAEHLFGRKGPEEAR
ncbi:MAG TPA: hypothetical protein VKO45_06045 [Methanomicrobiales archaeon]|nr:hypothetical protein [Methanomicrobiales archaeon]